MKKLILLLICTLFCLTSCKEHFSDGERVGTITKFSKAGVIWDSWDGHLNITQTGMNSAGEPFAFSLDNDRNDQDSIINLLSEAQLKGWKIKLLYHQVWGLKNVLSVVCTCSASAFACSACACRFACSAAIAFCRFTLFCNSV